VLRTTSAASGFLDGHPVGNGTLGAMVLASPGRLSLGLNHEWLWRSRWRHRELTDRSAALPEIREAFLSGDLERGSELARVHLGGNRGGMEFFLRQGEPGHVDAFQPAGHLVLAFAQETADLVRELALETATSTTRWSGPGGTLTADVYACHDQPVLVARIGGAEALPEVRLSLDRVATPDCVLERSVDKDRLCCAGSSPKAPASRLRRAL
jgi:alpha-L-fucosidase 2